MKKVVTPIMLPVERFKEGYQLDKSTIRPQHLYLTLSGVEPKFGDWFILYNENKSEAILNILSHNSPLVKEKGLKVIATTDYNIDLPIIHPEFVKYWTFKEGKVGKCEVEFDYSEDLSSLQIEIGEVIQYDVVKLDSDGFVYVNHRTPITEETGEDWSILDDIMKDSSITEQRFRNSEKLIEELSKDNLTILKEHCEILIKANKNEEAWSPSFCSGVYAVLSRINSLKEERKYSREEMIKKCKEYALWYDSAPCRFDPDGTHEQYEKEIINWFENNIK